MGAVTTSREAVHTGRPFSFCQHCAEHVWAGVPGAQRPGKVRRSERVDWAGGAKSGKLGCSLCQIGNHLVGKGRTHSERVCLAAVHRSGLCKNACPSYWTLDLLSKITSAHFSQIIFPRPACCPLCGTPDVLIGHGFYKRQPKDQAQVYPIRIKRWLCKACLRTLAVLPSFLVRFRHYLLSVIQQVLVARFEAQASWHETTRRCATPHGLPAPSTIRRWCRAFAAQAAVWWVVLQTMLAQQDAASPLLDPLGPAAGPQGDAPRALLYASLPLLAWAKTRWPQLLGYGLTDRLRFLWHWGQGRGLGRLV